MYRHFFKRLLDIILSLIGMPFFLVLLIFIGPIIYFSDKGNIFYVAKRLGKNGKVFNMYKFRSMKINAPDIRNEDGSTFNSDDDPRLTKIGKILRKTSIDEIPQIINVFLGTMSFIGPRPDLDSQIIYYDMEKETKFNIKPGITGYAQVNGRNDISWNEKNELDRFYAKNLNLYLDIKIFFKTIYKVLKREGVNKKDT